MPGMSGTAFVRALRLDPELRLTPCLLLTTSERGDGEVHALDAGADAYERKSEGMAVVLARLGAMLRTIDASRDRRAAAGAIGPARVLVIDDDEDYAELLQRRLQREGYDVHAVSSGEAALDRLRGAAFDCVVLDVVMPGLGGVETCRRIKQRPELRDVPVIMLSGLVDTQAMIEGMNAGADDYVGKSSDGEVLRARLRAVLRRKRIADDDRRIYERQLMAERSARVEERRLAMAVEASGAGVFEHRIP